METKVLTTKSELSKVGGIISLFTYYVADFFIRAFISNKKETKNNVEILEGEGIFEYSGYDDVNFYLNNKGELIINSSDNKEWYINELGELIMEETI